MISICMITKNEEAVLPRALANWRDVADELVIVDTGSTDNTRSVAEQLGARVLHYDWQYPGHKGEARNVGLDAATGDWIVVLDADEIIADPGGLRRLLGDPPEQATGINVLFENHDPGRGLTLKWYQVRVFRREMYRYKHREHELPHWVGDGAPHEIAVDFVFEHRTPAGREPAKMQPMLDRLALDVEENPTDPGPLYFLHRQYLLAGQYQQAITTGLRYLDLRCAKDPCECMGNLAAAHHLLGQEREAIRWLHQAAAEQPQRKIWWVRLAEHYMAAGRWNIALAHLRLASELWPAFEWQWEPYTNGPGLYELIDKCKRALVAEHHSH